MILIFLIVYCAVFANAATDEELWNEFKINHSKTYKTLREEKLRYDIFKSKLREIERHNARYENGQETYAKGVNQFSDLTSEEFKETYLMKEAPRLKISDMFEKSEEINIPDYVNWVEKGVVLPVRNQQACGSCWAFSSLAALESQIAIKHNKNISLSPQELLDCTLDYGNSGCNGGWPNSSYNYIIDHGISTEESYPYLTGNFKCHNQSTARVDVKILTYKGVQAEDEEALKQAVATVGPVSVLIVSTLLQDYEHGILDNVACSGGLDHAVVVVGYGTENGHDYWLVRNSWGFWWGEHGYLRMTRNKMNQCGIAAFPVYPIIA